MRVAAILISCLATMGCAGLYDPQSDLAKCHDPFDKFAVEACTRVIDSDQVGPKQKVAALVDRAIVHRLTGAPQESIKDLDQAIGIDGTNAETYFIRGRLYFELRQYDEAIENYDVAVKLNPKYAGAYNSRGHTHFTRHEWQLAIDDYTRAIEADPQADFWRNRGEARTALGQTALALADFDEAIRRDADTSPRAYMQRARARALSGEFDSAIADYDTFIDRAGKELLLDGEFFVKPMIAHAYLERGDVFSCKEDLASAIASYSAAIDTIASYGERFDKSRDLAQAHIRRSEAQLTAGHQAEAKADRDKALALDPDLVSKIEQWSRERKAAGLPALLFGLDNPAATD